MRIENNRGFSTRIFSSATLELFNCRVKVTVYIMIGSCYAKNITIG